MVLCRTYWVIRLFGAAVKCYLQKGKKMRNGILFRFLTEAVCDSESYISSFNQREAGKGEF